MVYNPYFIKFQLKKEKHIQTHRFIGCVLNIIYTYIHTYTILKLKLINFNNYLPSVKSLLVHKFYIITIQPIRFGHLQFNPCSSKPS